MKTYPICLIGLNQRPAVVVGGGQMATRKVTGLLEAEAQVTVISPTLGPELRVLAQTGRIACHERAYCEGDLAGAFLVVAATDEPAVNKAVWEEGNRRGCLVNVVDDPAHSHYIMPAIVRRGEMTITVSTGGASPALARRLREWLETLIGPEYEELVNLLAELRPKLLAQFETGETRLAAALRLVDSDLLNVIKQAGWESARRYALELLNDGRQGP